MLAWLKLINKELGVIITNTAAGVAMVQKVITGSHIMYSSLMKYLKSSVTKALPLV